MADRSVSIHDQAAAGATDLPDAAEAARRRPNVIREIRVPLK
jgi:hypothetical protein